VCVERERKQARKWYQGKAIFGYGSVLVVSNSTGINLLLQVPIYKLLDCAIHHHVGELYHTGSRYMSSPPISLEEDSLWRLRYCIKRLGIPFSSQSTGTVLNQSSSTRTERSPTALESSKHRPEDPVV
jgi:hypothetical protein